MTKIIGKGKNSEGMSSFVLGKKKWMRISTHPLQMAIFT